MKTLTVIMKPFAIGMHVCAADFWFCVARLAILVSDIAYSRKHRHWLLAYRLYDGVAAKPTVIAVMMLFLSLYLAASCFAEDKEPPELTQLKLGYETQVNAAMEPINQKYLTQLDVLKKKLGGQGKIEEAMVVQREIYRLTLNKPDTVKTVKDHGLVAYYPLNGNANDESGNGNHGTVNGATLTADRYGNADSAYSFNGNAVISVKHSATLDLKNEFTVSAWINFSPGHPVMQRQIVWYGDGRNGYDPCCLYILDTSTERLPVFGLSLDGQNNYRNVVKEPVSNGYGRTMLLTATCRKNAGGSKTLSLYVDGKLEEETQIPQDKSQIDYDTSQMWMTIGACQNSNWQQFFGTIDDIRIYNRALSDTEVSQIYSREAANPKPDLETDFRALYLKIKKAPPATNRPQIDAIIKEWQDFIDGHPDAKPDDKCIKDANTQIKNMQDMKALYSK